MIAFTRGVPPVEALPIKQLEWCVADVMHTDATTVLQYGHQAGYPALRELIAAEYGVSVDEVFVSNGSLEIQSLLSAYFSQSTSAPIAIAEQPTYDRALTIFRDRHTVATIPIEDDGIDVERLSRQIGRGGSTAFLYLIPDFQNPAGTTMSLDKRQAVVKMAQDGYFMIVEDVPYRKLRYRGEDLPLLRELDPDHVITVSSYSKLISPGLRVGFAIAKRDVIEALTKLAENTYLSPILLTQAVVALFIEHGWFDQHLERLKELYRPRMEFAIETVKLHLPEAHMTPPDGGFFVGLFLPLEARVESLVSRAKEVGLALTPGRSFYAPREEVRHGDRFVRLPFCALNEDDIDYGVSLLATLL